MYDDVLLPFHFQFLFCTPRFARRSYIGVRFWCVHAEMICGKAIDIIDRRLLTRKMLCTRWECWHQYRIVSTLEIDQALDIDQAVACHGHTPWLHHGPSTFRSGSHEQSLSGIEFEPLTRLDGMVVHGFALRTIKLSGLTHVWERHVSRAETGQYHQHKPSTRNDPLKELLWQNVAKSSCQGLNIVFCM